MEPLFMVGRPDLRPEQSLGHLNEAMVQMHEHDVVTPRCKLVVEDDGPDLLCVGVRQPLSTTAHVPRSFGRRNAGEMPGMWTSSSGG